MDAIDRRNLEDAILETVVFPTQSGLPPGPVDVRTMLPLLPDAPLVALDATLEYLCTGGLLQRTREGYTGLSPAARRRATASKFATHIFLDKVTNENKDTLLN
jgi:hypothetical protein